MCFFGSSKPASPPKPEFNDSPPVVTGMQTGVDNPIDTAKATEELKIQRQQKEGFNNPGESLKIAGVTGPSSRMSNADKQRRADNQAKAKKNFQNRRFSSYKKSVKKAGSSNVA